MKKASSFQALAIAATCGVAATFGAFIGSKGPMTFAQVPPLYGVTSSSSFSNAVKSANPNLEKDSRSMYKRLMLALQSMEKEVTIYTSDGVLAIRRNGVDVGSIACETVSALPQQKAGVFQFNASNCDGVRSVTMRNVAGPYSFGVGRDMLPYGQVATLMATTEADMMVGNNKITEKQDHALQAGYNITTKKVEYSDFAVRRSEFKINSLSFGATIYYSQSGTTIQGISYIKPGVKSPNNRAPHADAAETIHVGNTSTAGTVNIAVATTTTGNASDTRFFPNVKLSDLSYTMSSTVPGLVTHVVFKDKTGAQMTYKIFDDATGTFDLQRL